MGIEPSPGQDWRAKKMQNPTITQPLPYAHTNHRVAMADPANCTVFQDRTATIGTALC
jgi:hypothetical protein